MATDIFTHEWALDWNDRINENADYKKAAAKWEGAIGLIMTVDPDMGIDEERTVVADLWHGDCRGAKAVSSSEVEDVPYLIKGTPEVWKKVMKIICLGILLSLTLMNPEISMLPIGIRRS